MLAALTLVASPGSVAAQSSWDGSLSTSDGNLDVALTTTANQAKLLIEGKSYRVTAYRQNQSELRVTFLHRATEVRCLLKKQSGTNGYGGPCKTVEGGRGRGHMLVFPADTEATGESPPQTEGQGDAESPAASSKGQPGKSGKKKKNKKN